MDWLKDKKNQPIVAAIAVVVIIVVGVCLWLFVFKSPSSQTASTDPSAQQAPATPPDASAPGAPAAAPAPGAPAAPAAGSAAAPAPGAPTATSGGAANGKAVNVAVKPMETWRGDPFQPIGYKPLKKVKITPRIVDFPFERIALPGSFSIKKKKEKPEIQQPSRRMAGILLNDRIFAILESNGVSETVQPGDYTKDRLATVVKIESDKVILKTVDQRPRYITVRMASSPNVQAPVTTQSESPTPGYMPMGPSGMRRPTMPRRGLP